MKIKLHLIPEEGTHLEGDEPPAMLDVSEPLFRFEQPIHYALEAAPVGPRGLTVRGRLATTVRACCVRTLEWFDLPVVVEEFQFHSAEIRGDEVDLTREMREDILLALPPNPVAPHAPPVQSQEPGQSQAPDKIWGKLDQLNLSRKKIKNRE